METVSASHPLFLREPITVHTHGTHCGYRALAARYRGMPTLRSALFLRDALLASFQPIRNRGDAVANLRTRKSARY